MTTSADRSTPDRRHVLERAIAVVDEVRRENALHGAVYGPAVEGPQDLRDLDSFSLLELALAFEDEFGVSFDSVEFCGETLDQLVDYIVANARSPVTPAIQEGVPSRMMSGP